MASKLAKCFLILSLLSRIQFHPMATSISFHSPHELLSDSSDNQPLVAETWVAQMWVAEMLLSWVSVGCSRLLAEMSSVDDKERVEGELVG
uniref:Uncharacterized protein n=1 Tax=Cucumis sativus TaxID=3659 RepID=A0A0A0KAH3_CUCSA